MKKYKVFLSLLFITVLSFGCSPEIEDYPSPSVQLSLNTTIQKSHVLRMDGKQFENGDKIGVFLVPYEQGDSTPGDIATATYCVNAENIFNGSEWRTPQGEVLIWPGGHKADIFAYYPYTSTLPAPKMHLFKVAKDQTMPEALTSSDFLYAKKTGLSPQKNVDLTFSHKLSKININITSEVEDIEFQPENTSVQLFSVATTSQIDLSSGDVVVASTSDYEELELFELSSAQEGFKASYTGIIVPQTIAKGSRFMRIEYKGTNYYYYPKDDLQFQSGTTATFNINILLTGIEISVSHINEWIDGGSTSGNIGERAPRILDLDNINWSESYVHYIYDDDRVIGQVCREYLFRSSTPRVDIPAIVVYPLGQNGKMDITKGFVARVYNRDRNSSYEYEFNTGNVHGGSAFFGIRDTLRTYTPGQQPLINKVLIEGTDKISAAEDNAISTLITRPYLLTDYDNNTYPITKIGTQYWIQKNYMAEHYMNGEEIEHYYYNDNEAENKERYGAYYTWHAVTNPAGIAPEGWRVPERSDWYSLYVYVNPETGKKIKSSQMWSNKANADNVTGFSGLPVGRRTGGGNYDEFNSYGQWWSSTPSSTSNAWRLYTGGGTTVTENTLDKDYAESLRLMRDN